MLRFVSRIALKARAPRRPCSSVPPGSTRTAINGRRERPCTNTPRKREPRIVAVSRSAPRTRGQLSCTDTDTTLRPTFTRALRDRQPAKVTSAGCANTLTVRPTPRGRATTNGLPFTKKRVGTNDAAFAAGADNPISPTATTSPTIALNRPIDWQP
jgi:hypothetical protein